MEKRLLRQICVFKLLLSRSCNNSTQQFHFLGAITNHFRVPYYANATKHKELEEPLYFIRNDILSILHDMSESLGSLYSLRYRDSN